MGEVTGNAVIYARFSPRRNADECESIETQVEACRAYCVANGLTVAGEYEDREKSGADIERPGLWQAVDSLQRGWVLVVYKLDRLCRSVYLAEIIERAVAKRRARIVSIAGEGASLSEQDDNDEAWLIRRILQTFAEYQRRVTAARTKAAMLRHQRTGRRMSDKAPFGFQTDPDNPKRLVEVPEEQETIDLIADLREEGHGARAIARRLNEAEIPCRDATLWRHQQVQRVLNRLNGRVTQKAS